MKNPPDNIVFFDGICHVCDGLVHILLRVDKRRVLTFATQQGATYTAIMQKTLFQLDDASTIVFYSSGTCYIQSEAIIRIIASLGGFWNLIFCALIIPRIIRDGVYKVFALYRYRWFGKRDFCAIPSPEVRDRFLP